MPSRAKLAKKTWIGLVVICVSLALIYLVEPLRFQTVYPMSSWASHLTHVFGLSSEDDETVLAPSDAIGASARPELDLAGNDLLSCDRALRSGQLYLVTDWRLASTTARAVLHFQLRLPNQITQEITQTLDRPQLFTPLPAGFYAEDRLGTVWLKLEGSDNEQWMRVCKR